MWGPGREGRKAHVEAWLLSCQEAPQKMVCVQNEVLPEDPHPRLFLCLNLASQPLLNLGTFCPSPYAYLALSLLSALLFRHWSPWTGASVSTGFGGWQRRSWELADLGSHTQAGRCFWPGGREEPAKRLHAFRIHF